MKVDMVTQKSGKLKVSNCMKAAKKQVNVQTNFELYTN